MFIRQKSKVFSLVFKILLPHSDFLSNWITSYKSPWSFQPRKVVSLIKIKTSIWFFRVWNSLCQTLYWHFIIIPILWGRYDHYPCHLNTETDLGRLSNLPRSLNWSVAGPGIWLWTESIIEDCNLNTVSQSCVSACPRLIQQFSHSWLLFSHLHTSRSYFNPSHTLKIS